MIPGAARRPATVTMLALAVALAGAIAWRALPVTAVPITRSPRLLVVTVRPQTTPDDMEALVSAPVEAAARRVRGVRRTRSVSEEREGLGVSVVEVELDERSRLRFTWLELREAMAALRAVLPADVRGPSLQPYQPAERQAAAEGPVRVVIWGAMGERELRRLARTVVAPAVRRERAVASAALDADPPRVVDVAVHWPPPLPVAVGDVARAVQSAVSLGPAAGAVRLAALDRRVTVASPPAPLADVSSAMLDPGAVGRAADRRTVADVARVALRDPAPRRLLRVNGEAAVVLGVRRAPDVGPASMLRAVHARLQSLALPPGVTIDVDSSSLADVIAGQRALHRRLAALAIAVGVVTASVLRSARAAVAAVGALALAALAGVAALRATGQTLNAVSGAGLVVGATLVAHDVSVMLFATRGSGRRGLRPGRARRGGARPAWRWTVASALVMLAALVPLRYLAGEWRAHLLPLVVACAAGRVAGTLLCGSVLRRAAWGLASGCGRGACRRHPARRAARRHLWLPLLAQLLRMPQLVVAGGLALAAAAAWRVLVAPLPPVGAAPAPADVIDASVALARGTALAPTDSAVRPLERRLRATAGVRRVSAEVTPGRAHFRVELGPAADGALVTDIRELLVEEGRRIGGGSLYVSGGAGLSYRHSASAFRIAVRGPERETVRRLADGLAARVRRFARTADVEADAGGEWGTGARAGELVLVPDRQALANADVSAAQLGWAVSATVGARVGSARVGGGRLAVRVGAGDEGALGVQALSQVAVGDFGASSGATSLARLSLRSAPARVVREEQRYERVVEWEFRGPPALGERVRRAVLDDTHLPTGYSLVPTDDLAVERRAGLALRSAALAALVLVGLAVSASLESVPAGLALLPIAPAALAVALLPVVVLELPLGRDAQVVAGLMATLVASNAAAVVRRAGELAQRAAPAAAARAALRAVRECAPPVVASAAAVALAALADGLVGGEAARAAALPWVVVGGVAGGIPLALVVAPAASLLLPRRRPGPRG